MPRIVREERFLPFKVGDTVMVGPRNPNIPDSPTRINFNKIYTISDFYISIADLRCVYLKAMDGSDNDKTIGVRLNRVTHTLQNPQWEV
jgi:hypothetical protein